MNPNLSAALAATLWGFTYVVSTNLLPDNPLFIGAVRALGGGAALLLIARQLPPAEWWGRIFILGTLNCGLFFGFLFIGVLRLPGGIAATFQTLGPLFTILLAALILQQRPTAIKVLAIVIGVVGVVLIVFKGEVRLDFLGVLAALASALSMALGGVLLNKWGRPPALSNIAFTGWQLLVGGGELAIVVLIVADFPASLSVTYLVGLAILAFGLTAIPFTLWFRAIAGMGATAVAPYNLVIPVVAFILGVAISHFVPGAVQLAGVALVITGLGINQWATWRAARKVAAKPA